MIVACRVHSVTHENDIIFIFLGILAGYITFPLLSYNAVDKPFFVLKLYRITFDS